MMTRKRDGREIPLTEGEEAARLARWEADSAPPTTQELESEVQRLTDELLQNNERDKADALTTVDLVLAAVNGQLSGMSRADIRQQFRDRVVFYLRQERGL